MTHIMTVLGPMKPKELGFTSMHEHILSDVTASIAKLKSQISVPENVFPPVSDEQIVMEDLAYYRNGYFVLSENCRDTNDEALMTAEVAEYKKAGGCTMLDCSAPGIRPNIEGVKRISEATGVNIIASTGLYAEEYWPEHFKVMSIQEWVAYMHDEMQNGIEGTAIKAGHIKAAVNQISDRQLEFLQAAAIASVESGASVTTHLGLQSGIEDSRQSCNTMLEAGIDPQRLLLCHFQFHIQNQDMAVLLSDEDAWKPQLDYAREVLDQGFNICIDCFGLVWNLDQFGMAPPSDAYKIAAIITLLNEGYGDQIVIGTDIYLKIMTRRYGGSGYIRLLNHTVPTLKKFGVSDADIEKITVANPARLLTFVNP